MPLFLNRHPTTPEQEVGKSMKSLDILFSSLVLCISSLPLILLILTLQRDPAVAVNPPLDQTQINAIQQLLIDHDPRRLLASEFQEVRLTEPELNALTAYVKNSNPVLAPVNVHTDLIQNGASMALSIPVSVLGMLRYFNITLHFSHVDDGLSLTAVNAGALNIPAPLLAPLRNTVLARLRQDANFQLVSAFVDSLHVQSIDDEQVIIWLDWQGDNLQQLEEQARQVFVSAREAERLEFFHNRLVETLAALPAGVTSIRLNDLFRPLFLYASLNTAGGADPVAENRAVFIVLTAYLTELELDQLIGNDITLAVPTQVKVIVESREDLARHVTSSAAISAAAGAAMAEVLSVYKEVHDARYRTGFSFTDIAANQAGTLLGVLASRSQEDAMLFQDHMKDSLSESDYMPALGTYDGMTEAQFIEQFGSRDSDAYRQRLQEINDSILQRPFYGAFAD
jgi:hypothetical protein